MKAVQISRGLLDCGGRRSATPLSISTRVSKALSPLRFASAVQDAKRSFMLTVILALLSGMSGLSSFAQAIQITNALRFRAVDVFVNSKDKPLAAYQLEFTASAGVKIVGIEGGEHAAFKEAPFHDPKAIQQERVIIGAVQHSVSGQAADGENPRGHGSSPDDGRIDATF